MSAPFGRILLASEGTEFDVGAERVAIALAASSGVALMAVHPLVSNPEYESLAPELQEQAEAKAAAEMNQLQHTAQSRGVELRSTIRLGEEPFREIVDEASERHAELIVLRRRGKRGYLANLLLGEMVHTVTGHAPCDVLIVPRATQLWSRGILLATDGSPHSERATAVAVALAAHYKLPLTVVSVAKTGNDAAGSESSAQDNVDRALATIHSAGVHANGRVVTGDKIHEAILATAEETGADLIVIGRRGLNQVERILVGSTSEHVAGCANSPVLIVQQAPAA